MRGPHHFPSGDLNIEPDGPTGDFKIDDVVEVHHAAARSFEIVRNYFVLDFEFSDSNVKFGSPSGIPGLTYELDGLVVASVSVRAAGRWRAEVVAELRTITSSAIRTSPTSKFTVTVCHEAVPQ